jgi:ribosomal protein L11 methylase PrmA
VTARTARDNAQRNGAHPWIRMICADNFHHQALAHEQFDLIVATYWPDP